MAPLVTQCCVSLIRILYLSAYYAQVAGLYYSINHTGDGFQVLLAPFLCSHLFPRSVNLCPCLVSCDYRVATAVSI